MELFKWVVKGLWLGICSINSVLEASSQFYVVKSYKEIDPILEKNSHASNAKPWFVFDLDNTIITPDVKGKHPDAVKATDGYYYKEKGKLFAEFKKKFSESEAKDLAYREAVDRWNAVVKTDIPYVLMDQGLDLWLKEKQERGYILLGHTARERELEPQTVSQLQRVNVAFKPQTFGKTIASDHIINMDSEKPLHPEEALYKDGIFFVGRGGTRTVNHKGKRFIQLLYELKKEKNFVFPQEVVFMDDRKEHVVSMMEELSKAGIQVHGFHLVSILEEI